MYYPPEQFKMLDEAHALTDSLQGLAPKLYETLNAARADLLDRYPSDLFWDNQNKGAGALKRLSQGDLFAPDGKVSPDLSGTKLILAWREMDKAISVTAYRPLDVMPYAYMGSAKKYDFSLDLLDRPVEVKDFTPIEDNDDNLLPNLVFDDTSENENIEIRAEQ